MTDLREQEIRKDVYVVIATPKNGNAPFVYGVFTSEDYAIEHHEKYGCKMDDFKVTREALISL
ncbi:hypothetical protein D3C85_1053260 [compost metagenome]